MPVALRWRNAGLAATAAGTPVAVPQRKLSGGTSLVAQVDTTALVGSGAAILAPTRIAPLPSAPPDTASQPVLRPDTPTLLMSAPCEIWLPSPS